MRWLASPVLSVGDQRVVEHLFRLLIEEGQSAGEIAEHVDPIPIARALLGLCLGSGVIGEPLLLQAQALVPAPSGPTSSGPPRYRQLREAASRMRRPRP